MTEEAGVRAAVLDYVEGWFDGNAERMERALHPELVKRCRGLEGDDPDVMETLTARVLIGEREPMQARDAQARVETVLGEPVRWSSVKATLAGNLKGPAPRFIRVARGRYGVPSRAQTSESCTA